MYVVFAETKDNDII